MDLWGLSLLEIHELSIETMDLLMPDIDMALTFHNLSEDEPVVATLFILM